MNLNDQQSKNLVEAQMETVNTLVDALFTQPERKLTNEEILHEAIMTANKLTRLCDLLVKEYPFSKRDTERNQSIASNLYEAFLMADDAFTDLTKARELLGEDEE